MRWCAEDLGLTLRWRLMNRYSVAALPSDCLPFGGGAGQALRAVNHVSLRS